MAIEKIKQPRGIQQPRVVDVSRAGRALTVEIDASEAAELLLSLATLLAEEDRDTYELDATRIDELRVCGGQAQSRLWNQVKADVTGLPASVPRLPEVALMGDAICAAMGAGLYPDLFTAGEEMVRVGEVLEPRSVHRQMYDELFGVYQAAYGALKPLAPALTRAASL